MCARRPAPSRGPQNHSPRQASRRRVRAARAARPPGVSSFSSGLELPVAWAGTRVLPADPGAPPRPADGPFGGGSLRSLVSEEAGRTCRERRRLWVFSLPVRKAAGRTGKSAASRRPQGPRPRCPGGAGCGLLPWQKSLQGVCPLRLLVTPMVGGAPVVMGSVNGDGASSPRVRRMPVHSAAWPQNWYEVQGLYELGPGLAMPR